MNTIQRKVREDDPAGAHQFGENAEYLHRPQGLFEEDP